MNTDGNYLSLIPCRGDEFYCVDFFVKNIKLDYKAGYRIIKPQEYDSTKKPVLLAGPGAESFYDKSPEVNKKSLEIVKNSDKMPSVKSMADIIFKRAQSEEKFGYEMPELFYLSPSQAEINYEQRNSGN